jgi:phosphoenolpyruvate carboxylase
MNASLFRQPIKEELFINVKEVESPKPINSLVSLWEKSLPNQHNEYSALKVNVFSKLNELMDKTKRYLWYNEGWEILQQTLAETDSRLLFGIVRALHLKIHLQELDREVSELLAPPETTTKTQYSTPMVLQTFMNYMKSHGPNEYEKWVNSSLLRLVSTVHPNETERNSNLRHYASLFHKYLSWRRNLISVQTLPPSTPIYRVSREQMNQLRRAIKAEIESIWQSDQMRRAPISVESEATRILERYEVIVRSYPQWVKFIKHLNAEAFWRFSASLNVKNPQWRDKYAEISGANPESHREEKLKHIKATFRALNIPLQVPRISAPIISFGTWKGGDRDGNPFVIASFTNKTFIEHKIFILETYLKMVNVLLDKITPSINHVPVSKKLEDSLSKDRSTFPYIGNIKPHEKYRTKLRYVAEKLHNTLTMSKEVIKRAGATVKPLLGQSIVGPTGYTADAEFIADIDILYESLTQNSGKGQARSNLQDLLILANTFGFHLCSIDFRQLSSKNMTACVEYLEAVNFSDANKIPSLSEERKREILLGIISKDDFEMDPSVIPNLSSTTRDTLQTLIIFADASRTDSRAVGKFIISMCSAVSDYLVVYFFLKLVGMLRIKDGKISNCNFDVTGLFETVEDMKRAPCIISELLEIKLIHDYIIEQRKGSVTIMLGYSDSVRDGSSLASDAQVNRTAIIFRGLEQNIRKKYGYPFEFVFYRGRGDTLPRGYGGAIDGAILAQAYTTPKEDHTEQNRYLRRYFSEESAMNHYHSIYSAHLASQLLVKNENEERYQLFFDFFGTISNMKWNELVKENNGGNGAVYFKVLNTYSILPHLNHSHFASRPISRGKNFNIDTIRAIPFTMNLAQLRDLSSAFYGTGTGFELGSKLLMDGDNTKKEQIYYNSIYKMPHLIC